MQQYLYRCFIFTLFMRKNESLMNHVIELRNRMNYDQLYNMRDLRKILMQIDNTLDYTNCVRTIRLAREHGLIGFDNRVMTHRLYWKR